MTDFRGLAQREYGEIRDRVDYDGCDDINRQCMGGGIAGFDEGKCYGEMRKCFELVLLISS